MYKQAAIILLCLCFAGRVGAQDSSPAKKLNPFYRFADFHIHPTYKHYFSERKAKQMKEILRTTNYDRASNTIVFDTAVARKNRVNWEYYKKTKKNPVREGTTSTLRNYYQSGYPEVMYTPGSIYCNSYSPYEKQFAMKFIKRVISSMVVTGMGLSRLNSYSKDSHTPFHDFMAEYYFNLMQDEQQQVLTFFPDPIFKHGKTIYNPGVPYINTIKMVKDSAELAQILIANDIAFSKTWSIGKDTIHIITPMVMSIEGGQVLYNTLSSLPEHMMHPLNKTGTRTNPKQLASDDVVAKVHEELLNTVDSLRNLPHRLFFITLAHFAQNHVAGFAKTLDRDPENFQHRAMSTITKVPSIRNDIILKTYAGFNPANDIGLRIVKAFLDPAISRAHKKPTYIDVKHMDIQSRIEYYYKRREYERDLHIKIPIIASHFSVSGENQALAAATGLWPYFDKYQETEQVFTYYKVDILRETKGGETTDIHWKEHIMKGVGDNYEKHGPLNAFERGMYKPLNFLDNPTTIDTVYNPFAGLTTKDIDNNPNYGWFYPWSINLFDEEIIEINKSDGIIGLLMDPRQQGAFMPNYSRKKYIDSIKAGFNATVADSIVQAALVDYGFQKDEIGFFDYFKTEPLLRNLFYIVRLISREKDAEAHRDDTAYLRRYPWYIRDSIFLKKEPWDLVAIGSDYDGLIDPIDYAPTAAYIPSLHKRMIIYAYIYAQLHQADFFDPANPGPMIKSIPESEMNMKKFFYENGKKFITTYF